MRIMKARGTTIALAAYVLLITEVGGRLCWLWFWSGLRAAMLKQLANFIQLFSEILNLGFDALYPPRAC